MKSSHLPATLISLILLFSFPNHAWFSTEIGYQADIIGIFFGASCWKNCLAQNVKGETKFVVVAEVSTCCKFQSLQAIFKSTNEDVAYNDSSLSRKSNFPHFSLFSLFLCPIAEQRHVFCVLLFFCPAFV